MISCLEKSEFSRFPGTTRKTVLLKQTWWWAFIPIPHTLPSNPGSQMPFPSSFQGCILGDPNSSCGCARLGHSDKLWGKRKEACLRQSPSNLKQEVLAVGKDIFGLCLTWLLFLSFNCFQTQMWRKEVQFNIWEFYQVSGGSWVRDPLV